MMKGKKPLERDPLYNLPWPQLHKLGGRKSQTPSWPAPHLIQLKASSPILCATEPAQECPSTCKVGGLINVYLMYDRSCLSGLEAMCPGQVILSPCTSTKLDKMDGYLYLQAPSGPVPSSLDCCWGPPSIPVWNWPRQRDRPPALQDFSQGHNEPVTNLLNTLSFAFPMKTKV